MGGIMKVAAILFSLVSLPLSHLQAEDWPQFRGVNSSGVSEATNPVPTEFSFEDKLLWKADLGDGVGSAVIADGRVFTTAMSEETTLAVICHDAETGKELWKKELSTGELPRITPPNSHASSTPATDGERVYVYFSTMGIVAFDAKTGDEVWRHELPRPAFLMDWGSGWSPVIHDGKVFFAKDDDLTSYVLALDATSGKKLWQTDRPDMLAGYATPVICTAGGRTDLVVAGSGKLKGYDPETGKEIWTCNTLLRTVMTSPVVYNDHIYLAIQSYGDKSRTLKFALMQWLDTNQDGILARDETPKEFHARFDESDKNKDKMIDEVEIETAFQHSDNMVGGGNTIQAVRGGGTGDVTSTHLVWNIDNSSPSNLASPLVFSDRVHVVKSGGISSCFDAKTGEEVWGRTRLRNFGDYYASPIAADGKIYIAGRNGFVVVIDDTPELNILAKNDVGGEILATPSVADGRLFIRTRDALFCFSDEAK